MLVKPCPVVVAHEYPLVARAIAGALTQTGRYQVLAESSGALETLGLVGALHPRLLILDSGLGGIARPKWLELMERVEPQMKILILHRALAPWETMESLLLAVENLQLVEAGRDC